MACAKMFLSFLLVLVLASLVQSKMCDLDDTECLTKGASKVYKSIVTGANGLVEPLDPVHVDKIVGETPGSKYIVTNATMTDIKNCEVIKMTVKKEDLSFVYNLLCPKIFLYFHYEVKGVLGNLPVDGIAEEKITIDDYLVIFKGKYVLSISEKDKKPRGIVKNYVIETEPRGRLTFETTDLIRGDKEKLEAVHVYANEHWQEMEKMMQSPILEELMKPVVDKINIYLKEFPLEDIISQ